MKTKKITQGLLLSTVVAGTFLAGCELVVDFDRTKIPVDVSETSVPDANVAETSVPDASETVVDAGADASDAALDADAT